MQAVIGAVVLLSTSTGIPARWFPVPTLLCLTAVVKRRHAGVDAHADVPHDPRLQSPAWLRLGAILAGGLFTIVAIATDPSF